MKENEFTNAGYKEVGSRNVKKTQSLLSLQGFYKNDRNSKMLI